MRRTSNNSINFCVPKTKQKLSYNENEKHILQTDLFAFGGKKNGTGGLRSDRLPDGAEGWIVGGKNDASTYKS